MLGKNTLLVNPQYGNMLTLGALLLDRELAPDKPAEYAVCAESCSLCIKNCPAQALNGISVNQKACRAHSQQITKKGYSLYTCSLCRTICPHKNGL
jgi:epoxyqueuosine reductase